MIVVPELITAALVVASAEALATLTTGEVVDANADSAPAKHMVIATVSASTMTASFFLFIRFLPSIID
jgi:hypothetical protein